MTRLSTKERKLFPTGIRKGCDLCHDTHVLTEYFAGVLGHLVWVCLECYAGVLKWRTTQL